MLLQSSRLGARGKFQTGVCAHWQPANMQDDAGAVSATLRVDVS